MIEAVIVHNDPKVEKEIFNITNKGEPICINFLDEGSLQDRSKAYILKSEYGARKAPFILIMDNDKPIEAIYSESCDALKVFKTKYLKTDD